MLSALGDIALSVGYQGAVPRRVGVLSSRPPRLHRCLPLGAGVSAGTCHRVRDSDLCWHLGLAAARSSQRSPLPVVAYIATIGVMLVYAFSIGSTAAALGATLFAISDVAVARNAFIQPSFGNKAMGVAALLRRAAAHRAIRIHTCRVRRSPPQAPAIATRNMAAPPMNTWRKRERKERVRRDELNEPQEGHRDKGADRWFDRPLPR